MTSERSGCLRQMLLVVSEEKGASDRETLVALCCALGFNPPSATTSTGIRVGVGEKGRKIERKKELFHWRIMENWLMMIKSKKHAQSMSAGESPSKKFSCARIGSRVVGSATVFAMLLTSLVELIRNFY